MSERLDELVARLAMSSLPRPLGGLAREIARSIAHRREVQTLAALAPARVASAGLALAIGVTADALVGLQAHGTFSGATNLASSTLLDGRE